MKTKHLKSSLLILFIMLLTVSCVPLPLSQPSNANNPDIQKPIASSSVRQATATTSPGAEKPKPASFSEADCSIAGIIFNPISFGNTVDDVYDGPYLTCSYSSEGAHGLSETEYIGIVAYKADQLEGFYNALKENINGYIAQSTEWNAQPDLPADAKHEITMIRDDGDGFVFMITKYANVQGCTKGDGYGVEKVNGKYLVQIMYSSCEGTAPAYLASVKYLQATAAEAIKRLEPNSQP